MFNLDFFSNNYYKYYNSNYSIESIKETALNANCRARLANNSNRIDTSSLAETISLNGSNHSSDTEPGTD